MATMITPYNAAAAGQYTTQYHPDAPYAQPQQTQLVQVQRQGGQPQQHVIIQQAQPLYQQQMVQQQPIVQTRIVHATSPRHIVPEETSTPVRQFVNFKNLRHLNQPGQQWEHCEHITIALSPDELERKIRCHDAPGNDLIRCLTGMGVYRQRHVRKYEDKLNNREADPSHWMWTLEALGEVRDKPKATPHTFWAIFQRTARKTETQPQAGQVRFQPQVTVHHEPLQIVESAPLQPMQTPAPPIIAPLAPPQALSQPALQQPNTVTQYGHSTTVQPASSHGGHSPATYQYGTSQQQGRQTPYPTSQPPQYGQQAQQQRPQIVLHQPQQQQQPAQRPAIHQSHSAPVVRQITQGPAPQTAAAAATTTQQPAKKYTRPIPGPISLTAARRPASPHRSYARTSDIDVRQFMHAQHDHSPVTTPYRERRGWLDDDSMSDASSSSYESSGTDVTDYSSPPKRRQPAPAPLGNPHHAASSRRHRSEEQHTHTRHPHAPAASTSRLIDDRPHHSHHRTSAQYTAAPSASRPQLTRHNTIEVKIGHTHARPPAPPRSYSTETVPRSAAKDSDYDYDGSDQHAQSQQQHHHQHNHHHHQARRGNTNGYAASGLVSYGSDDRRLRRF